MRARIAFVSLGCPKNLVDTERMMDMVSKEGAILSGDHHSADIVVINTCGFLDPAKEESLSTIQEFSESKQSNKIKGLIVAGCMTERYLGLMREKYPTVDAFLQTKEISKIGELVEKIISRDSQALKDRHFLQGESEVLKGYSELPDYSQRSPGIRSFAYVKIAEGCNRTCSFCIIPKLRGKMHSRSVEGIIDEVKQLVAYGTKEIIFVAQDLTSYGRDRDDGASLVKLVEALEDIDQLRWFRLMYNYPRFFDEALISALAGSSKFTGYLDIPFQHFSDSVLKRMRRPESSTEISQLISRLKSQLKNLHLRTTLMVGFPGETDQDFQILSQFVKDSEFDHLGVFTYFAEKDTPSELFLDQVDQAVKMDRYNQIMEIQSAISHRRLKSYKGRHIPVVIDRLSEAGGKNGYLYEGRHAGQAPDIDGLTFVRASEQVKIGDIIDVSVSKIMGDYDLMSTKLNTCDEQKAVGI